MHTIRAIYGYKLKIHLSSCDERTPPNKNNNIYIYIYIYIYLSMLCILYIVHCIIHRCIN